MPAFFAHDTAVVDPGADIGAETDIWHFCHICDGADIGRGCTVGQNVYVAGGAVVGDGCKIQNNVSIYDGVHLDDDVFVGPSAVFTNVAYPRAHVCRRDQFEPARVGQGATIGANATVVCGTTIAEFALIGAGAVVTADVDAHALVVGTPARQIGWVCRCGQRLDRPAPTCRCGRCRRGYELADGQMENIHVDVDDQ